jgi:hypothetical protein
MNYRKLTKILIAELRQVRTQLEDMNSSIHETEQRLMRKLNLLREEQAREIEEKEYQEWQRKDILRDLERAKGYGDKYQEERCMEKLKRF